MDRNTIEEFVTARLVENHHVTPTDLSSSSTLCEGLGLDHIDIEDLLMDCEEHFFIVISQEEGGEIERSGTFSDLVSLIETKVLCE